MRRMPALRIGTFNLKDFFAARSAGEEALVSEKVAVAASEIRRARVDVLALQEVGSPELLERLVATHLEDLGFGAPVLGTADRRGIRNAVLARLPVLWSQVHTAPSIPFPRLHDGDPDPYAGRIPLRRGVVHVRIDAGELGEVDVLTVHFKSNLPTGVKDASGNEAFDPSPRGRGEAAVRSLVQRAAEALYVRGLVDDVFAANPDHAICVLGDLNDTVDSMPVRIVRGAFEPAAGVLVPCAERLPSERRFSAFHGGGPTLIDHILLSDRLARAVSTFDIQNEKLRSHAPPVGAAAITTDSDHALCVVELGA
jgi:endonuclease/exonuclease/phosphatase family metal-dependent hydrolase